MIFTPDKLQDVKLLMWEKVEMPASVAEKDSSGKTVFRKTGGMVEMTNYIFRDSFGTTLEIQSKNNDYRTLEGEIVDIQVDISRNDCPGTKVKTP